MLKGLKQGDTIGIIAPASPVTHEEIQPAINIIKQQGYNVLEGDHLYDTQGYLAGSDEDRLNDLHKMFRNNNIKAVLCARGGYGTPRLLDKVEYDLIKENPKLFIGYSDITALLLAVFHRTGIAVWHGPMLRGMEGREDNIKTLLNILSSGGKISLGLEEDNVIKKGKARGILLGGNLSLISALLGTPFLPSFKDSILFLEDRGEALYRIDRMLIQLKLSGALEGIRGLIAGNFKDCGEKEEIIELIKVTFSGDYPVCAGFPAGHGKENLPLPFGAEAELDTESLKFNVDEFIDQD
ncbi:MAG: LD-carboxypeptidase [Desulfobacteraceae bacterium]|jgi:muramoyltetrapeptide carboxypeptidase